MSSIRSTKFDHDVAIQRRLHVVTHGLIYHFGNIGANTLPAIHEPVDWLELDAGMGRAEVRTAVKLVDDHQLEPIGNNGGAPL
jgi:hypothetical protein